MKKTQKKTTFTSNQNCEYNDMSPFDNQHSQFPMPKSHHFSFDLNQYQNEHNIPASFEIEHEAEKVFEYPEVGIGRKLNPVYAAKQEVEKPLLLRAPILKIPQELLSNLSQQQQPNPINFSTPNTNMVNNKEENCIFEKQSISNLREENNNNIKLRGLEKHTNLFSTEQLRKVNSPIFNSNLNQFQNCFNAMHRETKEKPSSINLMGQIQASGCQSKSKYNSEEQSSEIDKNSVRETEKLIENTFISKEKETENNNSNTMYMSRNNMNYGYSFHNKTLHVPLKKKEEVKTDSRSYRTNYKIKFTIDIICHKTLQQIEQVTGKFEAGFINPHLPETMKEILEQIQINTYDGIYLYEEILTNEVLGIVFVKGACVGAKTIGNWGWDEWKQNEMTEEVGIEKIKECGASKDKKRIMKSVQGLSMWGDKVAIRWGKEMYVDEDILEEASIEGHLIDLPSELISSATITFYNVRISEKDELGIERFFMKNCKNLRVDDMKGSLYDPILQLIVVYL